MKSAEGYLVCNIGAGSITYKKLRKPSENSMYMPYYKQVKKNYLKYTGPVFHKLLYCHIIFMLHGLQCQMLRCQAAWGWKLRQGKVR